MSDSEPTPDDLLVCAVLDGGASPAEVQRVAADPRLAARLAEFRAVAAAVGGPVPLVDTTVREAHLARALAEGVATAAVPAVPASPPPPPPPLPVDLTAARHRRDRPRSTTILSVAAAVVLVVAAGAFLVRLGGSVDTADDSASSSGEARESSVADNAESGDQSDDSQAFTPDGSGGADGESAPSSPPSTIAGDAAGADLSLPDLGTFARAEDLAARVRGELILDPSPADLAATGSFADGDSCVDDFGVEVILLGRATLDGDEGLAYIESAPRTDRRLWLVDPGTVGTDDACREITPVQTL